MHESLRQGVTTHNWFVHYLWLWDIYGGFGHNGKIIQRTLPSHTQPSHSKLTVWASFQNFTHFRREKRAWKSQTRCYRPQLVCALPLGHIQRLWAQWDDKSTHSSLPYSAITLQIDCLGQFSKLHTLRKRNMCVKVSGTVLPPITGLCITFGTYVVALGTTIER